MRPVTKYMRLADASCDTTKRYLDLVRTTIRRFPGPGGDIDGWAMVLRVRVRAARASARRSVDYDRRAWRSAHGRTREDMNRGRFVNVHASILGAPRAVLFANVAHVEAEVAILDAFMGVRP